MDHHDFCFCCRVCATGLLIATCVFSARVVAQTTSKDVSVGDASLEQLGNMKVYSASKRLETVSEAPSFVTVISGETIRKFGYRTLAEVLQSVAGFYTDYDRNYTYVGVRGFSRPGDYNGRILVLLDGHRMNENLYDGAYVGTAFPLDLALVERIEVARGPSAALYGTNAFFAVVNVVTAAPRQRHALEITFDAASFGTFAGSFRLQTVLGSETRLLLSGTVMESAGASPLYFSDFDTPATNHGLTYHTDYDSNRSLLATLEHHQWRLQTFYGERTKGVPTGAYGTNFGDARTRTLDRRSYAELGYTTAINDRWRLTGRGYVDVYGYRGTYVYPADGGGVDVERDNGVGLWPGGELQCAATWKRHSFAFGNEFRVNVRQDQGAWLAGGPEIFTDRHDSSNWAVYAQDEYAVNKAIVLHFGLRYDRYSQFGGTTNPRAALVFRPWMKTAFKLIYGTAFRAPNAWELYYHAIGYAENPSLKPERVRTVEAMAEQSFSQSTRVIGTFFFNRISSLISQQTLPDGTLRFSNLGAVSARGMEGQLEANWGAGYQGRLGYTFQQTTDSGSHTRLSNSPRHLAKVNVVVPLKSGRLFAALEAQYTSSRLTDDGEHIGGATVVNLTGFAPRLRKNLDLSASIFNLLDRRYTAGEGDPRISPVIQDGRTYRLKVTYRF